MDRPRVSRSEAAFVIGVPLAWAVLLLFHPSGEPDEIYLSLRDQVTAWLVVHIGMMIFIPLMAGGIYRSCAELKGPRRGSAGWRLSPSSSSSARGRPCRGPQTASS